MEDEHENEARTAAQGLLDIALKTSNRSSRDDRDDLIKSGDQIKGPTFNRDRAFEAKRSGSPTRIPAFRPIASRASMYSSGRVITSGNVPPVIKPKEDLPFGVRPPENRNKEKPFFQPKPRRPEPRERVTLVVSKRPPEDSDAQPIEEKDRNSSFDLPVPPSAFAIPGRASAAESIEPRSQPLRHSDFRDPEGDSASDEEVRRGHRGSSTFQPPPKRSRLDSSMSASAMMQQHSRHDRGGAEVPGRQSLSSVQELVPWSEQRKKQRGAISRPSAETQEYAQRLWGAPPQDSRKDAANLMPRNSSEKSTLDVHRQLAQQYSGETVTHPIPIQRQTNGELAERDQAIRQHPSVLSAQTLIGSAPLPSDATDDLLPTVTSGPGRSAKIEVQDKEPEKEVENKPQQETEKHLWKGQVKHRLKTPTGDTSVAGLFSIQLQVPAKLIEQLPPTIFINVIVGRAQVKLGKHYVAGCRLVSPSEEEVQKATALASSKLAAICELQHCTVTLVPHFTQDQHLKLTAFLIADE